MGRLVVVFLKRKCQQLEVVKLVLHMCRFFTSFIVKEVDGRWLISPYHLAFHSFFLVLASITIYPVYLLHSNNDNSTTLTKFAIFVRILLLTVRQPLSLFFQIIHIDTFHQLMNSSRYLENLFSKIGSRKFLFLGPSLCYAIYYISAFLLTTVGGLYVLHTYNALDKGTFFILIHSTWQSFVMQMDVFCICAMIHSVQVSFLYLNRCLITMKTENGKSSKHYQETVELCCKAYNEIYWQVYRINTIFGAQLLTIFMICFIQMVDELYNIFYVYISKEQYNSLHVWVFVWASGGFTVVIELAVVCKAASAKAKEFNRILYQLMVNGRNEGLSKNRLLRLHIAMKKEIVFTACGFFAIDHTILHSIVAAGSKYLMILLQFSNTQVFNYKLKLKADLTNATVSTELND